MPAKLSSRSIGLLFSLVLFSGVASAQQTRPSSGPRQDSQRRDERQVFEAGRSAQETAVEDVRTYFGLSLGIQEAYDGNLLGRSDAKESDSITFFLPGFFVNLADRTSRFHFDYGYGYRKYRKHNEFDSSEHYANAQFSTRLSRRLMMNIYDTASYARNDLASPMGAGFIGMPNFSNEVYLGSRQMTIRNALTARLDYELGRRIRLGGWGTYNLYRFGEDTQSDGQSVMAGFSYDHQLNRWLDFSTSLATYIVRPRTELQANEETQISRLQLVGFTTRLSRDWQMNVGGSLEFTTLQERRNFGFGYNGAIRRIKENNLLSVEYTRGFSSGIGWNRTFRSHIVTAQLEQGLTQRISLHLSGIYNRSNELLQAGLVENYLAESGLEFALRPDLLASVSYNYQYQTTRGLEGSGILGISRPMVAVSLQWIIPVATR